jgi:BirA family biotin operon repressor/biotin-[acetyl-CoA-carboxylase] ligase
LEGGQLDSTQATWIVIGIGINLTTNEALESSIQRPIASLDQISQVEAMDADVLWLAILKELAETIELFEQHSFTKFQEEWNSWDIYKNKTCTIIQNEQIQHEGFERGVDDQGHLLIESNHQMQKIISGDVSLKAKA